jgi:acetylornithine/N-succinyldiaminopimelate aminotransferase
MARARKTGNESLRSDFLASIATSYSTPEIAIVSGKGAYLKDADGKTYLDFLSGIATNALGAAHPKIIAAVREQIGKVSHISNLYAHPENIRLASRLREMVGDSESRVFFCNSGAEANEAAIKLSRLTGRKEIIAMRGAFHGRTLGALSITGQQSKRTPFLPLMSGIRFVDFDDLKGLRRAVSRRTAMVIVEPIQGENGVVVPEPGFLQGVAEISRSCGALFAVDAVQTGMGRTGSWFGYEDEGVRPDIITLAKALGGGLPMGAMIATSTAPQFSPGQHGSTFGGNPIVAAAANVVIDVIEKDQLMERAIALHEMLKEAVIELPMIADVRGGGLLIGIVLSEPRAKELAAKLQENGILVNAATDSVIRLAPPLIVSKKEITRFVEVFSRIVQALFKNRSGVRP